MVTNSSICYRKQPVSSSVGLIGSEYKAFVKHLRPLVRNVIFSHLVTPRILVRFYLLARNVVLSDRRAATLEACSQSVSQGS